MQPGENEINEEWIIKTLTERKDLLKGVTITGGEPTLQPGLADFMEKLKILGFQVKLDTNGTRPQVIQDLLTKNLPDFIAMDIKGPWAKYEQIVGKKVKVDTIKQSIELIANSGLPHLFRTTVETKYLIPEDLEEIRTFLPKNSEYITQPYKQI